MFSAYQYEIKKALNAAISTLEFDKSSKDAGQPYFSLKKNIKNGRCLFKCLNCLGFFVEKNWEVLPTPPAQICHCKKISSRLTNIISRYFIDALQQAQGESTKNFLNIDAWTVLANASALSQRALLVALKLLEIQFEKSEFVQIEKEILPFVLLSSLFLSPNHILLDWNDLISINSRGHKNDVAIADILELILPSHVVVLNFGEFRFRLKSHQGSESILFERLITELSNKNCALIAFTTQKLLKPVHPNTSLLNFDYMQDNREVFIDQKRKSRFTSTSRHAAQNVTLQECFSEDIFERLVEMLAKGNWFIENVQKNYT